jgi:hypothetical protein
MAGQATGLRASVLATLPPDPTADTRKTGEGIGLPEGNQTIG